MNILIFGATGMVGQGVLLQTLAASDVDRVVSISRRPCGVEHERLVEVIHADFFDYAAVADELADIDAVFFCLGVSSFRMKEDDYTHLTYDLAMAAAEAIVAVSPQAVFCYVSGQATDSSEKGRQMWARVKGRLENALLRLPFKAAYMFRPGFIRPAPGVTPPSSLRLLYAVLGPIEPALKLVFPRSMTRTEAIGDAMLNATRHGYPVPHLENIDINALAAGPVDATSLPKRKRGFVRSAARVAVFLALLGSIASCALIANAWEAFGHQPDAAGLVRLEGSPQWKDGGFRNQQPLWNDIVGSLFVGAPEGTKASPDQPIPVVRSDGSQFKTPPASGLRVTWMGHSSSLVEIEGRRVLFDPIFLGRASPFDWVGPSPWYEPPVALGALPDVDAVVISHDHYDHLSQPTIAAIKDWDTQFIAPLGVGAHLAYWGVPKSRITEVDWWDEVAIGDVKLVATPSRHASGRHVFDQNETLWAGYALVGSSHRLFYSGDTGLFSGMSDIGKRLGPFDVTMIEIGAYNQAWPDWHIGPEQAVRAHRMLRGDVFLPVHWGLWDLAMHGWTEPAERVVVAAKKADVKLAMPRPGESIEPATLGPVQRWWPQLSWQTAEEYPIVSTKNGDPSDRM